MWYLSSPPENRDLRLGLGWTDVQVVADMLHANAGADTFYLHRAIAGRKIYWKHSP